MKKENNRVIVGFGIIVIILILIIMSKQYEINVQRCINSGKSEHLCRTELSRWVNMI